MRAALADTGLGDIAESLDNANITGRAWAGKLSGGQRQRAALGRALLIEAPLLVLDDALASVDNNTAAEILAGVRRQRHRTVLMISHQLSAAAACDRILVLEDGRLVQQGHHSELVSQPGPYRRLWEREQASERLQTA